MATYLSSPTAKADDLAYRVLGVVASNKEKAGVALMKDANTQKTFAVKEGSDIANGAKLKTVERSRVLIGLRDRDVWVRVGDEVSHGETVRAEGSQPVVSNVNKTGIFSQADGIERQGDRVVVSSTFRSHAVGANLAQILMTAAAVPEYSDTGTLRGFSLWEIDRGSVFELAGFKNGDLITEINGVAITDVGKTLRLLGSLKDKDGASVRFLRAGVEQQLEIAVQ